MVLGVLSNNHFFEFSFILFERYDKTYGIVFLWQGVFILSKKFASKRSRRDMLAVLLNRVLTAYTSYRKHKEYFHVIRLVVYFDNMHTGMRVSKEGIFNLEVKN